MQRSVSCAQAPRGDRFHAQRPRPRQLRCARKPRPQSCTVAYTGWALARSAPSGGVRRLRRGNRRRHDRGPRLPRQRRAVGGGEAVLDGHDHIFAHALQVAGARHTARAERGVRRIRCAAESARAHTAARAGAHGRCARPQPVVWVQSASRARGRAKAQRSRAGSSTCCEPDLRAGSERGTGGALVGTRRRPERASAPGRRCWSACEADVGPPAARGDAFGRRVLAGRALGRTAHEKCACNRFYASRAAMTPARPHGARPHQRPCDEVIITRGASRAAQLQPLPAHAASTHARHAQGDGPKPSGGGLTQKRRR